MDDMQTSTLEGLRVLLSIASADLARLERFVARMVLEHRDADLIATALHNELIQAKRFINAAQVASREIVDARHQLPLPL